MKKAIASTKSTISTTKRVILALRKKFTGTLLDNVLSIFAIRTDMPADVPAPTHRSFKDSEAAKSYRAAQAKIAAADEALRREGKDPRHENWEKEHAQWLSDYYKMFPDSHKARQLAEDDKFEANVGHALPTNEYHAGARSRNYMDVDL